MSNTPPAALVRSILCSSVSNPSAEMRGQCGIGSAALSQIHLQLLSSGQYYVAVRLLSLHRHDGKGAEGARLSVKYTPSCSCQVSTM
jgi:hypothetical protein